MARGTDLVLDITARHFDTAGCPRREHAYGTLTRVETQHLIAALVAFLASTPDRGKRHDVSVSYPTIRYERP